MLYFQIQGFLKTRGIDDAQQFLSHNKMPYHQQNKILYNKVEVLNLSLLEKLCELCDCTPNDLLAWKPDEGHPLPSEHQLHKLAPKNPEPSPTDRIRKLPLHKLNKLKDMLDELEKE